MMLSLDLAFQLGNALLLHENHSHLVLRSRVRLFVGAEVKHLNPHHSQEDIIVIHLNDFFPQIRVSLALLASSSFSI